MKYLLCAVLNFICGYLLNPHNYYHLHFADERTEIHTGYAPCPTSHSWDLNLVSCDITASERSQRKHGNDHLSWAYTTLKNQLQGNTAPSAPLTTSGTFDGACPLCQLPPVYLYFWLVFHENLVSIIEETEFCVGLHNRTPVSAFFLAFPLQLVVLLLNTLR